MVTTTLLVSSEEIHNVSVLAVTPNKTIVGKGMTMRVNVTIENNGDFSETFNVSCFGNAEVVGITEITLNTGSKTITFFWNTTDLERGDYRIFCEADVVNENATDNQLQNGKVFVALIGDTNNDSNVDIYDVVLVARLFGHEIVDNTYDPNQDINDDEVIDIYDVVLVASHFGDKCTPQYSVAISTKCTNGIPITDALIEVFDLNDNPTKSGYVDGYGKYYPMLESGGYYLNATTTVGLFQQSENFTVPETENVTMTFGIIDILVRDQNHAPMVGVNVFADDIFLGVTASDGHVKACGLLGPGQYTAKAKYQAGGTIGTTSLTVLTNGTGSATITKGAPPPPEYDVTIKVRHQDGSAIPGSSVVIADSSGSTVASGNADGGGNFQTGLIAEDYTVRVTSSSNGAYKEESFSVTTTTTVTVTFNDRVRVTAKYENGTLVKYASVEIQGTGHTGSTGSSGVANLGCGFLSPSTSYIAKAWKGAHTGSKTFTTNSDGGADVTVTI